MDENTVTEDVELERMMRNMSVDDFVHMMMVLGQQEDQEEDDLYYCPMSKEHLQTLVNSARG